LEAQMKSKSANQPSEKVRRDIQMRAYHIWEGEGRPQGREREHWLRAEAEILSRKPAKTATSAKPNGVVRTVPAAKARRATKPKQTKPAHPED
jgi:hypothetical protein